MSFGAQAKESRPISVAVFPGSTTLPVILGASGWTLSIAFFVVQAIAQASSARPFSLTTNLISDLGNTSCGPAVCSRLHDLMNGTFIAVGVLHFAGAATTWRTWPSGMRSRIGLVLLALAGWGLAYAGVFPENVAPDNHRIGALLGLVGLNVSMLLLGSALIEAVRAASILALVAGLVGLASLALFISHPWGVPAGILERLSDYPGAAMVVFFGAFILVHAVKVGPGESRFLFP